MDENESLLKTLSNSSELVTLRAALRALPVVFDDHPEDSHSGGFDREVLDSESVTLEVFRLALTVWCGVVKGQPMKHPPTLLGEGGYYNPDGPMFVGSLFWSSSHQAFDGLSALSNFADGDDHVSLMKSVSAHDRETNRADHKTLDDLLQANWNSTVTKDAIRAVEEDVRLEESGDFQKPDLIPLFAVDTVTLAETITKRTSNCFSGGKLSDPKWQFWRQWYQGVLAGKPLDWELQKRIALIDDEVWNTPEAVADEIERIEAEFLAEKLPMAETIELNPETGKFRAVPIPVENASYMSALLTQIGDALEDCLGGHNGLSDRSGDVKKLNRVLTKYRDDPQNAELTLTTVAGSLRRQLIETRELPPNEDNHALLHTVEEGVRGIRANHPEVAANRDHLAQQAFKALAPEDKQVLEEALPMLTAISEPELAEEFAQDIPELINDALLPLPDGAPPLPGADAATRVFSRSSKMVPLWEKLNAAHDGKVHRIATMGLAAYAVSELLFKMVSLGLRLLGVL
ncbi:hypothetical protein PhaeoP72_02421 [Phaeobacter inhibens]|nr:hypothetical protein PhaeoP72_02421 [Phaeobacter inhibens]